MKSNNYSILDLQHGAANSTNLVFNDDTGLKSLWIEIPDYCHLHCDYCYASTDNEPKQKDQYLSNYDYEKILREFAALGGKYVGIPGKGEPFHQKNWKLTQYIIEKCDQLGLELAIFTTGDAIFFDPKDGIEAIPKLDKIDFIKDKNVILLIKCNSLKPDIQNKLVNDKRNRYAQLREKAFSILIDQYHLNDFRRLGIVTSVMKDNEDEIVDLYKWADERNIIFDCDTILERGRGKKFTDDHQVPAKVDLDKVFKRLKDAGAINSCQGGTYVGSTCDRVLHHLYISVEGDVYPCIGCLREDIKDRLVLGNVKSETLSDFWESENRKKLATNHKECFTGTCQLCQNFQDEKCYSCLGRCTVEKGVKDGMQIATRGCVNHKPVTTTWIIEVTDYIRLIRSYEKTKTTLENDGLEYLWMPNNNIAFSLFQLKTPDERKASIDILLRLEKPQETDLDFHKNIIDSRISDFSRKKHYKLSEISFPMNRCWDFLREPEAIFDDIKDSYSEEEKNKVKDIISKSFLSNIFLSSFKILFDKHDPDCSILRFCNFMLYDNFHDSYFYRSITSQLPNQSQDTDIRRIIIANWYEDFKDRNFWKEYCHDLSDAFSDEIYGNYELILKRNDNDTRGDDDIFDFSDFIEDERILQKSSQFSNYVSVNNENFKVAYDEVMEFINSNIFNKLEVDKTVGLRTLYENVNKKSFFSLNDSENKSLLDLLKEKIKQNAKKNDKWVKLLKRFNSLTNNGKGSMFVNYLVFLRIIRDVFDVNYYSLIYSTNFKDNSKEISNELSGVLKPSGLMFCSSMPLNIHFKSELRLFVSEILNPFDEFYFKKNYSDVKAEKEFNEKVKAHRHSILNIRKAFTNTLKEFSASNSSDFNNNTFHLNIEKLQVVYEIYNIAVLSGITEKSEMPSYFGKTISNLIDKVCIYCEIAYTSLQLKYDKGRNLPNLPSSIDAFTVIFNLFVNAAQTRAYSTWAKEFEYYKIKTYINNDYYFIEVRNPAVIDKRCIDFINETAIDLVRFPYNELIKEWGGLSISKRLCRKLGWLLSVEIEKNWTVFVIKINTKNDGK